MELFEAHNLAASYPRKEGAVQLFSDLSFKLEAGNIYDLTGTSGSGKSTLLRVCALMLERTAGELFLQGRESTGFAPADWRKNVCLVPQIPALVPGTVRDNLVLPWKFKAHSDESLPSEENLQHLLECAELPDIELDRDASQLSGGQTARIALLRVFATKPQVMLLDEVDAALDDESAHAIGRLTNTLVNEETTCLRIRHRTADGFASGVFTLDQGVLSYSEVRPS